MTAAGPGSTARTGARSGLRPAVVFDEDHLARNFEVLHLRVIHSKLRTGFEETKDFPIRVGELVAGRYQASGQLLDWGCESCLGCVLPHC